MASLEEMITCSQCSEVYREPKTLDCQHTFCKSCLVLVSSHNAQQEGSGEGQIVCPQCREVTEKSLQELSTSFAVDNLIEISNIFKLTEEALKDKGKQANKQNKRDNKFIHSSQGKENSESNQVKEYKHYLINNLQHSAISLQEASYPWGIAKVQDSVIVAEWGRDCVSILKGGEKEHTIPITKPRGVAITHSTQQILVSNPQGISLVDIQSGLLVASTCLSLNFKSPTGISVHPQSKAIYVADADNHRIQVLTPDLKLIREFEAQDSNNKTRAFSFPWDVSFDTKGMLYVADGSSQIFKYTQEGWYLGKFGIQGTELGEINRPSSIVINASDVLYLSELHNNRISLFTTDGCLHSCYEGKDCLSLSGPCSLFIDQQKEECFVTDCWNDRYITFKTTTRSSLNSDMYQP